MSRIVVAGGSGFIGRHLTKRLKDDGHDVVVLGRNPSRSENARFVVWDAKTTQGDWVRELDGALAVVNLTGEPINQRWTTENKRKIVTSRVESAKTIGQAILEVSEPPKVWANSSAIGYYGDTGDRQVDETSGPGIGFLAGTCLGWETVVNKCPTPATRKLLYRAGVVMGKDGGAFPQLWKLARLFLGGSVGSGEQFVPWIHIDDLVGMLVWAISGSIEGPLNGVAPEPARNRDLMAAFRKVAGRPWSPPVPAFMIRLSSVLTGVAPDLLLHSSRVVPANALREGYSFRFPDLQSALADLASK